MIISTERKYLHYFYISLSVSFLIILFNLILLAKICFSQTQIPQLPQPHYVISLIPDQLRLIKDVATKTNTIGNCTEPWLSKAPDGSIIIGVNSKSCDPKSWKGGSVQAEVFLPDLYSPTIYVIELSWPDLEGKGLHSPFQNQMVMMTLDDQQIWSKSTLELSAYNDYYAAEHEPIKTTIVITKSDTHNLTISVPANTAWDLSKIQLIAYPYPKSMKGIGYSPFRDCQYPRGSVQPTDQNIKDDLVRLLHTCTGIRTYSATGINGRIPAIANKMGLEIFAGVWINGIQEEDEKEVKAIIELADTTELDGIIVGNEFYLRHHTGTYDSKHQSEDTTAMNYLLKYITKVKDKTKYKKIPITTAELAGLVFDWNQQFEPKINPLYKPILDEIDFLLVHIYPFWDSYPIFGAADYTIRRYLAIKSLIEREYPRQNKRVIIGEAGWPSGGSPLGAAIPSMANQRHYMLEFLSLAEKENVEYMYFDAFDELWKIEEPGFVGQHWGYSYSNRTAKHSFYGVLIPSEQLPKIDVRKIDNRFNIQKPDTEAHTFYIYDDWPSKPGTFYPSGWMGDTKNITIFECDPSNPYIGDMAARISFDLTGNQGWCGIYWLANDSWAGPGIDIYKKLNVADTSRIKLTFWARGRQGVEIVQFKVGGVGRGKDSMKYAVNTDWIRLRTDWTQYCIKLSNKDLSNLVGGFCCVTNKDKNPGRREIQIFLDKIRFELE